MPAALITGITGQDGSYLAELLHERGYEVHGLFRPGRQECDRDFETLAISRVVHRHHGSVTNSLRINGAQSPRQLESRRTEERHQQESLGTECGVEPAGRKGQ